MLKLKNNIVDMLYAFVKPGCVGDCAKSLETYMHNASVMGDKSFEYEFSPKVTKLGRPVTATFSIDDFGECEELKPYIPYPKEKFDGNPHNYLILELDSDGFYDLFSHLDDVRSLTASSTHFMYIERFGSKHE